MIVLKKLKMLKMLKTLKILNNIQINSDSNISSKFIIFSDNSKKKIIYNN